MTNEDFADQYRVVVSGNYNTQEKTTTTYGYYSYIITSGIINYGVYLADRDSPMKTSLRERTGRTLSGSSLAAVDGLLCNSCSFTCSLNLRTNRQHQKSKHVYKAARTIDSIKLNLYTHILQLLAFILTFSPSHIFI